jgi:hypothetical protein
MVSLALLDNVDTEYITERARQVSFGKTLARIIIGLLFLTGWVIAKLFSYTWFAVVWVSVAFAEGFKAGRVNVAAERAARARRE